MAGLKGSPGGSDRGRDADDELLPPDAEAPDLRQRRKRGAGSTPRSGVRRSLLAQARGVAGACSGLRRCHGHVARQRLRVRLGVRQATRSARQVRRYRHRDQHERRFPQRAAGSGVCSGPRTRHRRPHRKPHSELRRLVDVPIVTPGPTPGRVQELQLSRGTCCARWWRTSCFAEIEDRRPRRRGVCRTGVRRQVCCQPELDDAMRFWLSAWRRISFLSKGTSSS